MINDTTLDYDSDKTIQELFEQQAKKSSDKTAVVFGNQQMTYRKLNEKANMLARLIRSKGVKRNAIVGLMVERSIEMIVAMLAIIKAGAAYLPIDLQFPVNRNQYMLNDSGTNILLTLKSVSKDFDFNGEKIYIDAPEAYLSNSSDIECINESRDLIYVIYTSGSTGKPKGVMVEHRAVHNFINGICQIIDFLPEKTIVSLTTISFDIHVLETLLALCKGLTVVIADPRSFYQCLGDIRIDMLQTTPSTMQLILNNEENLKYIRNIKDIMLGGEAFPPRLLKHLKTITKAKIYNMYGPTETTVWSMVKELTLDNEITIGKPIANTQVYILDGNNHSAPIGAVGELCISGDGVARGYLNRDELTSKKFINNPFIQGERLYKTGDMAKWLQNGEIEFIGRVDNQVKIRGFRIELAEIEQCLLTNTSIKECAVTFKENQSGDKYLVAYYTSNRELSTTEIIAHLSKSLPEHMIPRFYIRLEELPLTPNGKLDRNALPDPDTSRPNLDTRYQAPGNDVEERILEIWKKIINCDAGTHDNFFELGGNSILLSMMYSEIEKLYPGKISITQIFSYPTISKLAKYIIQKERITGSETESLFIKLPPEYFQGANFIDNSYFEFNTNEDIYTNLKKIAIMYSVSVNILLQSLFIYLLTGISGQQEIGYILRQGINEVFYLKVHLENISGFSELVQKLKECLRDKEEFDFNNIRHIKSNELSKKSIILAIINDNFLDNIKVPEIDISLYINEGENSIFFKCEFNSRILSSKKVQAMMAQYLKLLQKVSKNYSN